jgi:hypothetical protein
MAKRRFEPSLGMAVGQLLGCRPCKDMLIDTAVPMSMS